MKRAVLRSAAFAALVLLLAVAPVGADAKPGGERAPENRGPIEVLRKDGKVSWKIKESGVIPLYELLMLFAEAAKVKTIHFDFKWMPNRECCFMVPEGGSLLEGEEIGHFVANLLEDGKVVLLGFTRGMAKLVTVNDAASQGVSVTSAELGSIHGAEFVTYTYPLRAGDGNAVAGSLRGFLRPPMSISPVAGAVVVSGRASQVRDLCKSIAALDVYRSNESYIKRHEIPEGADSEHILSLVQTLFLPQGKSQSMPMTYTLSGGALIVRGTTSEHDQVAELITLASK